MFAIAVTDNDWFENVRAAGYCSVNFWTPTPWGVRSLAPGDRWYFMRKAPIRRIGGYGVFVQYRDMTVSDAWAIYDERNGLHRLGDLVDKVESIAGRRSSGFRPTGNPVIGCVELDNVVTVNDASNVDLSTTTHEFARQIVKFKGFQDPDELVARF